MLEDGRRSGEAASDFQWTDAHAVLDPASATPYHFLTRARGGAKTSDVAGMAIVALLAQLASASRAYGLAADRVVDARFVAWRWGSVESGDPCGWASEVPFALFGRDARAAAASLEPLALPRPRTTSREW